MEATDLYQGKLMMRKLRRAKPWLEKEYTVHIPKSTLLAIVDALKASYPDFTGADVCKKAKGILKRACKLVAERFAECAYEREFRERQDELCYALIDLKELCGAHEYNDSSGWIARARRERDESSIFLADFLNEWKKVLNSSAFPWICCQDEAYKLRMFQSLALKLEKQQLLTISPQVRKNLKFFLEQVERKLFITFTRRLLTVTKSHVWEVASSMTGVPVVEFAFRIASVKETATRNAKRRVVGQDSTIDGIFEVLSANMGRVGARPRGLFLLVGQHGSGITEIAKTVAQHWYGDVSRLVKIDVKQYCGEYHFFKASRELSPREKENFELFWSRISEVVGRQPYSVILLDDVYCAAFCIRILLKVLHGDDTSRGHSFDFSKCIIFLSARRGTAWIPLNCTCFRDRSQLEEAYELDPVEFERTHDCSPNTLYQARALGRVFIGHELFDSMVDRVIVVDRLHNEKAVCRILVREIIRDVSEGRQLVHISDAALNALLWKSRADFSRYTSRKVLKEMLDEEIRARLISASDGYSKNAMVYIDTLVGTEQLSFRFETSNRSLADCYFGLKEGTFSSVLGDLRVKVQSARNFFEAVQVFRRDFNRDLPNFVLLGRSLLYLCKCLSNFSPIAKFRPNMKTITRGIMETASDMAEEREKVKDMKTSLLARADKGPAYSACHVIIDALTKIIDAPLDDFIPHYTPRTARCHLVLCPPDNDAKRQLIVCLTESLNSIFTYINLRNDGSRGHRVRRLVVERVQERPCAVFMFDGVEYADEVLYRSLVEILGEGSTLDDDGQPVDFGKAIVILMSDAANTHVVANFLDMKDMNHRKRKRGGSEFLPWIEDNLEADCEKKRRMVESLARVEIHHRCVKEVKRFRSELLKWVGEVMVLDPSVGEMCRFSMCNSIKCLASNAVSAPSLFVELFQCGDRDDGFFDYLVKEASDSAVKFHLVKDDRDVPLTLPHPSL